MLLYFIRHGETEWNREKRVMGRLPVPLSEEGIEGVRRTARFLSAEGIGMIYSGTLKRATETSNILSREWGAEIRTDSRLDESAFEEWTGKRYAELKNDPDFVRYGEKPTSSRFSKGEDMRMIQERAVSAVGDIVEEETAERTAVVSHSDVIKPVLVYLLGMDLDGMHRLVISNASVTLADLRSGMPPRIRYMNLKP